MRASLTLTLLAFFVVLVLIESLFTGILYLDIMSTDREAQREFHGLSICQDVYGALKNFTTVARAFAESRNNPQSALLAAESVRAQSAFSQGVEITIRQMHQLGVDEASVRRFEKSIREMSNVNEAYNRAIIENNNPEEAYKKFLVSACNCFGEAARSMTLMHKLLNNHKRAEPVLGLQPLSLLMLAAAVNIIYLFLFAAFVEGSISRPVSKLALDCERIKLGQVLDKPRNLKSEIEILQFSFHQMSEQILESETRRKSYVELMQTVQSQILKDVQERIQNLSGSSSELSEKAKTRLKNTGTSLNSLVDLLQSMSQTLGSDGQSQRIQPVELSGAQLAEAAVSSVDSLLSARKISIKLELCDCKLYADPALISRVIVNLLSNAIKYSPDGGSVTLSLVKENEMLRFNVKDEGPGISAEGKLKLFKRFSQLNSPDGVKRAGTGLGLVICKEFVEAHGGQIACESEPGKGSLFWFSLPLTKVEPGQLKKESTKENAFANRKRKSIKSSFLITLLLFIAVQAVLFLQLHKKLSDSEARTNSFAHRKNQVMETQELMVTQAYFGKKLQVAAVEMKVGTAKRYYQGIKKLYKRLSELVKSNEKGTEIYQVMMQTKVADERFLFILDYVFEHLEEVMSDSQRYRGQVEERADAVINGFMQTSDLQNKEFKESFDWSQELKTEVLGLLAIAAVVNLLVILVGAIAGLRTARRILVLKSKAEAFSKGGSLSVSLLGNDEIALLDERLCAVANAIREAEYQRQELMAIINHDLRTPLGSILGTLEMIIQKAYGPISEDDNKILEQSRKDLLVLLWQINDLLLLEKIESGAYNLNKQKLELFEVLSQAVLSLEYYAEAKNLGILMPSKNASEDLLIDADKDLVLNLFGAILKNAINAAPCGSDIVIEMQRGEGFVDLSIEDQGAGLAPELLPLAFDRFRFVEGKPLNGLGLPLAKNICNLHSASIQIKSRPGKTTVQIRFSLV